MSFFDRYRNYKIITNKNVNITKSKDYNTKIFNKLSEILCPFDFYENYMYLTPESIIYNYISEDELSAFFYVDCEEMDKEY